MNKFKITKGYNLQLKGSPNNILDMIETEKVLIHPSSIKGIKSKLLVKENDDVKIGTPLFFDKKNPKVMFVSSASGKISKIDFGERRVVKSIEISVNDKAQYENLSSEESLETLSKSGLMSFIRQRPFSRNANPDVLPKSIFVSAMPTAPYSIDYSFIYNVKNEYNEVGFRAHNANDHFKLHLQKGIDVLTKLTNSPLHIASDGNNELILELKNVTHSKFNKLHPAGNVGIQIHNIDPIKDANDVVWYLSLQDLHRIGEFFNKGLYPNYKYYSIGGNVLNNPKYVKAMIGTPINTLLKDEDVSETNRIISGDVLNGLTSSDTNALNYFDDVLSVIEEKKNRDFLGWLMPGLSKFSLSRTFLSKMINNSKSKYDTKINGSIRSIIPMGTWDKVLPMSIYPEFLVKNILAKDIDMMEKLGIYECDPEDFSLCSLACQSKVEVSKIIEEGLELVEEEN